MSDESLCQPTDAFHKMRDGISAFISWGHACLNILDQEQVQCEPVRDHLRKMIECAHHLAASTREL